MTPRDPTLAHAVTPLAFDRMKLHRERLVKNIHDSLPRKLISIVAPPGYGKSTLLADFAAHTTIPACWLRLTPADTDVMRLANLLRASLRKRFRRLRGRPDLDGLSRSSPEALARAFVSTIETDIPEAFILVVDDLHLVNPSPPALTFLDALLRELPSQMAVLAAGQELPDLSLAELVVDADMVGLGPHDLALTHAELDSLAELRLGRALEPAEQAHLLSETQGWITGVLLSNTMLGTSSRILGQRSRPMVYEYLAAIVLGQKPDDLVAFMLDSSVLPVMTAAACDAVLQRHDSQRILTRLVREGLFVVAAEQTPRSYEYHPLMRRFLLESLGNKDPARLRKLRKRAARQFSQSGMIEDAVQLYYEAGAAKQVGSLVARHAEEMHGRGRVQTLEEWARMLDELGAPSPVPFVFLAGAYTDRGQFEQCETSLKRAFGLFSQGSVSTATQAHAWNAKARLALHRGNFAEVLSSVERAEELLDPGRQSIWHASCLRLRVRVLHATGGDLEEAERMALQAIQELEALDSPYTLAQALLDLSLVQTAQGRPFEAAASSRRAHEILLEIGTPLPLAISSNNLAVLAHREGEYEAALDWFMEGLGYAQRAAAPTFEAHILFGQADVFSDLGLPYQAAELYARGLRLATQMADIELLTYGNLQTSVLHRRCGTSRLPLVWLERAREVSGDEREVPAISIQLAALTLAASADVSRARLQELLDREPAGLDADQRTLALYFLGRSALQMGDDAGARQSLEQAVAWSGLHRTEQLIAGELTYDKQTRDFLADASNDNPIVQILLQRVELMQAIARKYQKTSIAHTAAKELRLRAFGGAEILLEGEPVTGAEPLPRQILFYLADHVPTERDRLMEAIWPNAPLTRQTSSLYTGLHALRNALAKDVIHIEGLLYRIDPDYVVQFDVAEFEQVASTAESLPPGDPRRLFALTEAIHACTGPFLPEFSTEWVVTRRRDLERRFLALLTAHAEEAVAHGQPRQAEESIRQALEIDPLRDDLNFTYLQLLYRLDRRNEAIGHYQRYSRLLADELGIDPPPVLRDLYTRLLG